MSYCRFLDADAYIFLDVGGYINCCACSIGEVKEGNLFPESFKAYTTKEMLNHIKEHRNAGDMIPFEVDEALIDDDEINMAFIREKKNADLHL